VPFSSSHGVERGDGFEPPKNVLRFVFFEEKPDARRPAIFLDRDGVINCRRPDGYVLDWSQFFFVPGIRAALRQLSTLRVPMIVISNQAAVGKGLLTLATLHDITVRMQRALSAEGTILSAAYYCPHRTDEKCMCRKPQPGLLLAAAKDCGIDLPRSVFAGDSETDILAASAAGCQPVLIGSGLRGGEDAAGWAINVPTAPTPSLLFEVVHRALESIKQL
jgi:D-glycero-D-manno-heptose 1,7-bisphosphate phosphatase